MVKMNEKKKAMVIVPTLQLKAQWETVIKTFGLSESTSVYVINTIALKDVRYQTDLLVIDEIHLMAAPKFSRIFELVKYNWLMGLTATIDRLDGKEKDLKRFAPVVKTISQKMAIENGWINDFVEFNVPVFLTREEKTALDNLSKKIRGYTGKFGDFDTMTYCMNRANAVAYAKTHYPSEDSGEKGKELIRDAVQGQRCIIERKAFLYKTEHKVAATVDLINEFGLKTITFSQSTQFADDVRSQLGRRAVAYHSNLETEVRMIKKEKVYKTINGAQKFINTHPDIQIKVEKKEDGSTLLSWKVPKKIGSTTLKKEAIKKFTDSVGKVDTICTAKALDQGFDVPDVELGIDASRTTNPTQHTQRTGRIARKYVYKDGTEKQGVFVNLFVPNTQDEKWLDRCQKNAGNIVLCKDIEECKTLINKLLG